MSTTYLNPVELAVNDVISFTSLGRRNINLLAKRYPILLTDTTFEIESVKTAYAEDEHTELLEHTIGATKLKCTKTGQVVELEEDDPFWAFFTEHTPHFFNKQ